MHENLKSLVTEVAYGNQKAFRALFDLYSPKIFSFAFKLTRCGSTAEEVVQEVFIKIWINRATLTDVVFFPSYVNIITRNHCFNVLKKMAFEEKGKIAMGRDQTERHDETEQSIIYRDYQHILNNVIEALPPQQRLVYSLCHSQGLKYEEAAQRLNISRLTVKTHMQQALRAIKANFSRLLALIAPVIQCFW
jgi:RNA polymerase sigma-70 factor (ECF subfamily)